MILNIKIRIINRLQKHKKKFIDTGLYLFTVIDRGGYTTILNIQKFNKHFRINNLQNKLHNLYIKPA